MKGQPLESCDWYSHSMQSSSLESTDCMATRSQEAAVETANSKADDTAIEFVELCPQDGHQ